MIQKRKLFPSYKWNLNLYCCVQNLFSKSPIQSNNKSLPQSEMFLHSLIFVFFYYFFFSLRNALFSVVLIYIESVLIFLWIIHQGLQKLMHAWLDQYVLTWQCTNVLYERTVVPNHEKKKPLLNRTTHRRGWLSEGGGYLKIRKSILSLCQKARCYIVHINEEDNSLRII